jgi:hypothetical protein
MRHVATALLVLGFGITAMAHVAYAQVNVAPNSSTLPTPSGLDSGVAGGNTVCLQIGPCTVCPLIGPCYEPQSTPSYEPLFRSVTLARLQEE